MAKLKNLFELQRFAVNKELEDVISETHSRYSNNNIIELGDAELELVAAGIERDVMKEQECQAMCPKCNKSTTFKCYSGGRAVCTECGEKTIL